MQISILDRGARAVEGFLNTQAIQSAIDEVASAGGGAVIVPAGHYLTGMIQLRSHVHLHLEAGAVVQASPRVEDHPKRTFKGNMDWDAGLSAESRFHLLVADGCDDIAITGTGVLDGNGPAWCLPPVPGSPWARGKPDQQRIGTLVEIHDCRDVRIRDVTLRNTGFWTLHLHESDRVWVRGVRIWNPWDAPNADGIDITGCRDVLVSDCHIDTADDGICIKTFENGRSAENIAVNNCIVRTHCAALKLGCVESFQDMRNISFSNCLVRESHRLIGLYSFQGGEFENIRFSNIVGDTRAPLMFTRPIHMDLRKWPQARKLGAIRGVRVEGVQATTAGRCVLTALPGAMLEDISLSDVLLRYPLIEDPQPCAAEFGGSQFSNDTPWARLERGAVVAENVRGLRLRNIDLRWPAGPPPADWIFEDKAANNTLRMFKKSDFLRDKPFPFHAVALRNVIESQISTDGLNGYAGGETLHR